MHIQSYSMINRRTRKTLYISRQTRSFAVLASTSHVAPPLQYHVTWRSSQKSTAFQVQRGKLKLSIDTTSQTPRAAAVLALVAWQLRQPIRVTLYACPN
jgi:hypothetical protein